MLNPKLLIAAAGLGALFLARNAVGNEISYAIADKDRFDSFFLKYGRMYGVSPALLKGTWLHESLAGSMDSVVRGELNPDDVEGSKSESDGKSFGQMQITPDTANRPRVVQKFGRAPTIRDLNTAEAAIHLAAIIFWELGTYYFTSAKYAPAVREEYMIRAYNGGPGFQQTVAGQRDTPIYYGYVKPKVDYVRNTQPQLA